MCRSTYNFRPPFTVTSSIEEDPTSGFKVSFARFQPPFQFDAEHLHCQEAILGDVA